MYSSSADLNDGGSGERKARTLAYLPLSLLVTGSVLVLPVVLVSMLVPKGGVLTMALSAVAAIAVSLAIAAAENALWQRRRHARDVVFADLMLWGWLRRVRAERALQRTESLYEKAAKTGAPVSIDLVERLSRQLEARDPFLHGHNKRVARNAERIARAMYLDPAEVEMIRRAAAVHDVGKLYTPQEILNKPGSLTPEEFEVIKRHAADGAGMLAAAGDLQVTAMVRHHHERFDGAGYPEGLSGMGIPLGARIIAVADAFDAITSNRVYRRARSHKQALQLISREAGRQFDPDVVAVFLGCYSARRAVASWSFAAVVPERIFAALQIASSGIGASAAGVSAALPVLGAASVIGLSAGLHDGKASAAGVHRAAGSQLLAPVSASVGAASTTTTSTRGDSGQHKGSLSHGSGGGTASHTGGSDTRGTAGTGGTSTERSTTPSSTSTSSAAGDSGSSQPDTSESSGGDGKSGSGSSGSGSVTSGEKVATTSPPSRTETVQSTGSGEITKTTEAANGVVEAATSTATGAVSGVSKTVAGAASGNVTSTTEGVSSTASGALSGVSEITSEASKLVSSTTEELTGAVGKLLGGS